MGHGSWAEPAAARTWLSTNEKVLDKKREVHRLPVCLFEIRI
jgi:hypothetical protein